ncbi:MAG TPA: bifunctional helix-turn-helix transcriptional regulator/GNAT family N-acetyltransferase [Pseudorhodoplanes sp.]|jgi:DNA-binding MarR family transcriptional regulator/GNAT superfamily N-acetyltransferase|nr:bifunctional helix-turn-helix transcriptional regulator/GNAT family N-acetyltransferase [Pseudorhodoplanes sp.]
MPFAVPDGRIAVMRRFSRFYTRQIGLLHGAFLQSPYSLTEGRVLYELSHRDRPTASEIAEDLGLDHGYLSRILQRFEKKGLVTRTRSKRDGRQSHLALTAKGRKAFAPLDRRSHEQVRDLLQRLAPARQKRVTEAMRTIESLIADHPEKPKVTLRAHRPGDMGWVVEKHGAVYAQEYGWNSHIEEITAEIVAAFLKNYDSRRERCWIAEVDGEIAGCVFLVRETDDVARLRLLMVDPCARGLGIGKMLVDECVRFARDAGYRSITLWTHAVLKAARRIYQSAGFKLTKEWVHDDFGKPEAAETWDLDL